MDINKKKMVFVALNDVLIKSANHPPKGIWDMQVNMELVNQLARLNPLAILIVENETSVGATMHPSLYNAKFMYVLAVLQEATGHGTFVAGQYCGAADEDTILKTALPRSTMLEAMYQEFLTQSRIDVEKSELVMIGCNDVHVQTADNIGCDYVDCNQLIEIELPEPMYKVVSIETGKVVIDPDNQAILENLPKEFALHRAKQLNLGQPDPRVAVVPNLWTAPKPLEHKHFEVDMSKVKGKKKKVAMGIVKGGKQ